MLRGRFVRACRKPAQHRRTTNRARGSKIESTLRDLAGDRHFFYGSLADIVVVKEAHQEDGGENSSTIIRSEMSELLAKVEATVRSTLVSKFDEESDGELAKPNQVGKEKIRFLRVLKASDSSGGKVPWVIYLTGDFKKPHAGSAQPDRWNWFLHIREIADAVSIEKASYRSKYIELFETYMLLHMHDRGPSSFSAIADVRRKQILNSLGWFPEYGKAPWKEYRQQIVERLESNSHLASIALDPLEAWCRLKKLEEDASEHVSRVFVRRDDSEKQITEAPEMPYRLDVLRRIGDFAHNPESGSLLSLSGGPGTGKTTLIASYLAQELRQGNRHPCFFVKETHRPSTVLGLLATKIKPSIIHKTGFYGPQSNESALALFEEALATLSRHQRRVVFIDGLDEAESGPEGQSVGALLAQVNFPKHARFVVSGRPTEDLRRLLQAKGCGGFAVELKVSDEQNAAIREYYEDHLGKAIVQSIHTDLLVHKTEGSFLYAQLAVPEIKDALETNKCYDARKAPKGLNERMQREWHRLCRGPLSKSQLTQLLACAAAHRGWPTLEELAALTELEFAVVEAFFATHEYLFALDRGATPFLDRGTRVLGFRNSELRRFFVEEKVLRRGMERAHTRIVNHYFQGGKRGWPGHLDDYSLQYLVQHASLSERPASALKILCREFVEKKRKNRDSLGSLAVDCDAAVEVATRTRDLGSLLKIGLLRSRIAAPEKRSPAALFPFLRAAAGEHELALDDARSLGPPDDHLLTLAELITQRNSQGQDPIDLLSELEACATGGSPEILEYIAVRVLHIAPDTALELANAIPEPALLEDLQGTRERPTRTLCLWMLTQEMAGGNPESCELFIKRIDATCTTLDSLVCRAALAARRFKNDIRKAIEVFRQAHSMIDDPKRALVLGNLFVKWLLWHIHDIDIEETLEVLRSLSDFLPMRGNMFHLSSLFDVKFDKRPQFWIDTAPGIPPGWARDFLAWRLFALGHLPRPEPSSVQDATIRDILHADYCVEGAKGRTDAALSAGYQLETLQGYSYAIGGMLQLLSGSDPVRTQQMVHCFLENSELKRDWCGLASAVEILKATINTKGRIRHDILTWCLDTGNALEPELDRPVAAAEIGRVLRSAFATRAPDNQPDFFKGIMTDLNAESHRYDAAEFLIQELRTDECIALARRRREFDLSNSTNGNSPNTNETLLTESRVHLLLLLSRRVRGTDAEEAEKLILEAAELCVQIPSRRDSEECASEVLKAAMRHGPVLFWKVYDRYPVDRVTVMSTVRRILTEQSEHNDLRDVYLRLELERSFSSNEKEESPDSVSFAKKRLVLLYQKEFPKLHVRELMQDSPSPAWLQDLVQFVLTYVERFRNDLTMLSFLQHDFMPTIAGLDWQVFMEIARRSDVGPLCVGGMNLNRLRNVLARSTHPSNQLLGDVEHIASIESPLYRNMKTLNQFTRAVLQALAAYYPEGCLKALRSLPREDRCQFALYGLPVLPNCAEWSTKAILTLWNLFQESQSTDQVLQAKLSFLVWLNASQGIDPLFWKKLYDDAAASNDIVVVAEVAKHLSVNDTALSSSLWHRAVQLWEQGSSIYSVLTVLEQQKDIDTSIRKRFINRLAGADAPGLGYQVAKIACLQAEVDPREALRTLSRTQDGFLDEGKIIETIVQHVNIANEADVEDWLEQEEGNTLLKEETRTQFRVALLRRAVNEGLVASTRLIRRIADAEKRFRLLIQFAVRVGSTEGSDLLEEVKRELENTGATALKSYLYELLGNAFLSFDWREALQCYKTALDEAMQADNGVVFHDDIMCIVKTCFSAPSEFARNLSGYAMEVITRFPYDRDPFVTPETCKFDCILLCALAMKACDHPHLGDALRLAAAELRKVTPLTKDRWFLLSPHLLVRLGEAVGPTKAQEVLDAIMSECDPDNRGELADAIATELSRTHRDDDGPLSKYGILQGKLDEIRKALVLQILPRCSKSGSMKPHLALAVTLYEESDGEAKNHIRNAATLARELVSTSSRIDDIRVTIWLALGVIGDEEDVVAAIPQLIRLANPFEAYASWLLLAILNKSDNRGPLLCCLTDGLWAIEDQAMPV